MKKTINDTWEEVREGIRAICKGFPETYWQKLDQEEHLDYKNFDHHKKVIEYYKNGCN